MKYTSKLEGITEPAMRRVMIPLEKERLRQNFSMMDVDGGIGTYCRAITGERTINVKTLDKWLDALGMDIVFINREGEQV